MNKRGRMRVPFRATTELVFDSGEVILCESRDLSTNGVLLVIDRKLDQDKDYRIRIQLNSDEEGKGIDISIVAELARAVEDGYAFTFKNMDIDSFTHLKNLVMYNTDQVEEFIEECDNRVGFK
jgi:hypothetical protein